MKHEKKLKVYVSTPMIGVTGSLYLVDIKFSDDSNLRLVIDCGKENIEFEGYETFSGFYFNPESINCVLLTHCHLDHFGKLAELYHDGASVNCKVICTPGTSALLPTALMDAYHVDQTHGDATYGKDDVEKVINSMYTIDYNQSIVIEEIPGNEVKITCLYNAHIPGACMYLLSVSDKEDWQTQYFLFSGDYKDKPALAKKMVIPQEIYELPINLFLESTYGNTIEKDNTGDLLIDKIERYLDDGKKNIVIPSISLERLQIILLNLKYAQEDGRISADIPIFVHAPLGMSYSEKFMHDNRIKLRRDCKDFYPENMVVEPKIGFSETNPQIIIAGGGMGHGPSRQYIIDALPREDSVIIFTCYQAEGTLGRKILDEKFDSQIQISDSQNVSKKAAIDWTGEFSGHAHLRALRKFIRKFDNLRSIAISHGEASARANLIDEAENIVDCPVRNIDRYVYFTYVDNELHKIRNSNLNPSECDYKKKDETISLKKKKKKKEKGRKNKVDQRNMSSNNRVYNSPRNKAQKDVSHRRFWTVTFNVNQLLPGGNPRFRVVSYFIYKIYKWKSKLNLLKINVVFKKL